MSRTEKTLEDAARDGSLEVSEWPRLLEALVQRLHDIVHNDFPKPDNDELSRSLLNSYQSSVRILERDFAQAPPYTVQRLAELVLQPRKHYKYLPSYLRALDRVVSVSSPTSDFPLPTGVTNGFEIQEREGLGSDEALGGALLTPIPWLRNDAEFHSERTETIIGPNGAGSIETVSVVNGMTSSAAHTSPNTSTPASPTLSEQSDASTNSSGSMEAQLRELGGVTQGELLRQEQEAGVIPVAQARRMHMEYAQPEPEEPHARGPDEIGMADTGLVQNRSELDMEAAVGRQKSPEVEQENTEKAEDADTSTHEQKTPSEMS